MFARNLNDFKDYHKDKPAKPMSIEAYNKAITEMEEIIFPAINERTKQQNDKCKEKFDGQNKMIKYKPGDQVIVRVKEKQGKFDAEYEGPYTVVCKTKGGSYVLKDLQNDLERRDYTPSELKLVIRNKNNIAERVYMVDRILAHKKEAKSCIKYK
ncbi:hypothetical protein DFQ29_001134, partial [Apophysomyces sp. BC1021]